MSSSASPIARTSDLYIFSLGQTKSSLNGHNLKRKKKKVVSELFSNNHLLN